MQYRTKERNLHLWSTHQGHILALSLPQPVIKNMSDSTQGMQARKMRMGDTTMRKEMTNKALMTHKMASHLSF